MLPDNRRNGAVEPIALAHLKARVRQLRTYRLLVNAFVPVLVMALAALAFRWVFPYLFSVLTWLWTTETLLLLALAVAWALGSWAFASGKFKCPACHAPFATKFHLWVRGTCQACGYDLAASGDDVAHGKRGGPG
jgi:hypothetical protein